MATAKKSTIKTKETPIETTPETDEIIIAPPVIETEVIKPEIIEPIKEENAPVINNTSIITEDMTDKQKVLAYIESRSGSEIQLNDFLKSLFPFPKNNEPAEWVKQGSSKYLKELLSTMQSEGDILLTDNSHLRLGRCYHKGEQQLTCHYNLNDIKIIAKK